MLKNYKETQTLPPSKVLTLHLYFIAKTIRVHSLAQGRFVLSLQGFELEHFLQGHRRQADTSHYCPDGILVPFPVCVVKNAAPIGLLS